MGVEDTEAPEQALRILKRGSFDLAILDMHMPGMDGAAVLTQAERRHPVDGTGGGQGA